MSSLRGLAGSEDASSLWRTLTASKLHQRSPLATFLTYALLIVLAVVLLYPMLWMASSSVRSLEEIARAGLDLTPKQWHFDNYIAVFQSFPFWAYLKNSILTTLIPIIATILSSSLVAFAFARMRVPGRNILFVFVLATMFLPGEVTIIPNFILFRNLGMINTLYPLILPSFFGSPFFIFLLRQFYAGLPKSLEEAAVIEGATMFQIWWKIFLPLSKPALVAVGVLTFMGHWNDFFGPLIYLNSDRWKTLAVGLAGFQNEHAVQTNLLMAATMLMILPCVLLFFFAQRAFVEGVTFTGSKKAKAMTVTLNSSDKALVGGWYWAVTQAMQYVRRGDPVGAWFEAALPGRNGFCMRDVAHQSVGAQVLGLRAEVKNMLHRFAENISPSRDWCTFWEISGDNLPVVDDYRSDQDFWYNLPANFDVLDCCWRQYLWTGDTDYLTDPVFVNFYDRTVDEYVHQWDSDDDGLLEHQPEFGIRGIGSYEEATAGIRTAGDLVAAQTAGYAAYAQIQRLRGNLEAANRYDAKAAALRQRYENEWWNPDARTFYSVLQHNSQFSPITNFNINNLALYFGLVQSPDRAALLLDDLAANFSKTNVEAQSYFPEVAYAYGDLDKGDAALRYLIDPTLKRRDYPEISYSVVGALVTGLMGIAGDATRKQITTIGRLAATEWISIDDLAILGNRVAVRHQGNRRTSFYNQRGQAITWEARFIEGTRDLLVDGTLMPARCDGNRVGQPESWVTLTVLPGELHIVEMP